VCYLVSLPHLANASGLNEVWQHKGGLLNAPLALQVLPLLAPMPGHRHTVTVGLHAHQARCQRSWCTALGNLDVDVGVDVEVDVDVAVDVGVDVDMNVAVDVDVDVVMYMFAQPSSSVEKALRNRKTCWAHLMLLFQMQKLVSTLQGWHTTQTDLVAEPSMTYVHGFQRKGSQNAYTWGLTVLGVESGRYDSSNMQRSAEMM